MNTLTMQTRHSSQTPTADLRDLLTDHTKTAILTALTTPKYYEDLLTQLSPITRPSLTLALQTLTRTQLITSQLEQPDTVTKVRYQLTPFAQTLLTTWQEWQQRYTMAQLKS
ncbi:winged helix-turn-helix transcriptional regulator [Lactiplantibacillus songbeiensis]|uniref:Winged helix-turn-helix transcriptional regulator n=1 Tax=Lactiplantibacillus songbeiensis TaxID=2559920 RepID=A0ABW4C2N6_9LACO|nr:winged helix-turn-helix transcriptional regulator [Lactiplantibacillus songbeiensis]